MARAPTTELWHFEHMCAPGPSHAPLHCASVMHGLSLPWRFGDQGQSYVAVGPGVGGGAGVDASMRFHCWSGVTPSLPRHASPLMYLVPPYIWIAVMQIVSPPNFELLAPRFSPSAKSRDFWQRDEAAPSIDWISVPAYGPGMGKQLDGCRVAARAAPSIRPWHARRGRVQQHHITTPTEKSQALARASATP